MYEVEVKVESPHGPVRERLVELGAERRGAVRQRDTYYDHPGRSFAETDEALRLRRESPADGEETRQRDGGSAGTVATLTYKGPKVDDVSKTRREIETDVASPAAVEALLGELGFEPAATVAKHRERFTLGGYAVALDRVDGLGEYVEVEAAAEAAELADRRAGAMALLGRLGLSPEAAVRTSYLGLLLGSGESGDN